MLRESLVAPVRSSDSAGTAVVGSVLLASVVGLVAVGIAGGPAVASLSVPLALLPWSVLRGYGVRTVEAGIDGAEAIPSFVGWGGLLRVGLKATVLDVGYLLPSVLLYLGGGLVLVGVDEAGFVPVPVSALFGTVFASSVLLLVLASLVGAAYFHPAGVASMAATGRLRAGFDPRRVLPAAVSSTYAVAWVVGGVVTLVGLAVAVPLAVVLVGLPFAFGVRSVTNSLYGRGTAHRFRDGGREDASGADPTDSPTSDAPPEVDPEVQVGRSVARESSQVAGFDWTARESGRPETDRGTED